jgi:hypothetical protein
VSFQAAVSPPGCVVLGFAESDGLIGSAWHGRHLFSNPRHGIESAA